MAVVKVVTAGRTKYAAVINLPAGPDGKRRQVRRVKNTRAEAKRAEGELLRQRDEGRNPQSDRLTLSRYLVRWLEEQDGSLRASTVKRYRELVAHIDRDIGHVMLPRLTPTHVLDLYGGMRKLGLANKTILNAHRVLKKALKDALKWDLVQRNICDFVDPPRAVPYKYHVITLDELRRVFEIADARGCGPLVRVAAWTGLRLGELLALTWSDITDRSLSVTRSVNNVGVVSEPKTRRSNRTIALSPETVSILAALPRTSEFVFGPYTQSQISHIWRGVREAAGIPRARFHDLRHAHASHLIAASWPVPLVSERLGHSQTTTTLNIYSHALPGQDREMANAIDDVMS